MSAHGIILDDFTRLNSQASHNGGQDLCLLLMKKVASHPSCQLLHDSSLEQAAIILLLQHTTNPLLHAFLALDCPGWQICSQKGKSLFTFACHHAQPGLSFPRQQQLCMPPAWMLEKMTRFLAGRWWAAILLLEAIITA